MIFRTVTFRREMRYFTFKQFHFTVNDPHTLAKMKYLSGVSTNQDITPQEAQRLFQELIEKAYNQAPSALGI